MSDNETLEQSRGGQERLDQLIGDVLADPDRAALFIDPAAVIVQLAAYAVQLQHREREVLTDWAHMQGRLMHADEQLHNLAADRERLHDAALHFATELGLYRGADTQPATENLQGPGL